MTKHHKHKKTQPKSTAKLKCSTDSNWEKYKDKKTSKGYTFSNAIQAGVLRPHLGVGMTMGDEECFELFKDMVYPIVKGWHGFDPYTQVLGFRV